MSRKLLEAVARLQPAVDALNDMDARQMERVENEHFGIVAERWLLPNGTSCVVFGTPFTRDVYVPAAVDEPTWDETIRALKRRASA